MAETADRVTRIAADLMDSAAAEGARQSRSAKQQLDHWARVGRAVSSRHSAARAKVEAALAGELQRPPDVTAAALKQECLSAVGIVGDRRRGVVDLRIAW